MDWLLLGIFWMLSSNKHDKLQQERNAMLRAALSDEARARLEDEARLATIRSSQNWGLFLSWVAVIILAAFCFEYREAVLAFLGA